MRNDKNRVPDFNSFKTCTGDKFHLEYASKRMPDGTLKLSESGRTDIQAKIQSYASECDMAVIISKLKYGDTSVLSSKQPMYGDFTQFPSSYAEMLDLVTRSEKAFDSLSPSIKQQFDNDIAKWFSSIGSPEWLRIMGLVQPDPVKESEVSE